MKALILLILITISALSCCGQVFTKNRKFVYKASYYNKELNFSTAERLELLITGNSWKHSEKQLEAIWQYHTAKKTRKKLSSLFSIGWHLADTSGIIENEQKYWLHPPRHNQYSLTETAPFPEVRKDLKEGDSYRSLLKIGHGFGQWSGKEMLFTYRLEQIEQTPEGKTWQIKGSSEIDGKSNLCKFFFSEKSGFISMQYDFYNGDRLSIDLTEF
ncbi:MAG TPA: hypothetical protein VK927_00550 [Adhaeribacter sp.]|nr:hypothetical protein [Adhaeribacter sp.]